MCSIPAGDTTSSASPSFDDDPGFILPSFLPFSSFYHKWTTTGSERTQKAIRKHPRSDHSDHILTADLWNNKEMLPTQKSGRSLSMHTVYISKIPPDPLKNLDPYSEKKMKLCKNALHVSVNCPYLFMNPAVNAMFRLEMTTFNSSKSQIWKIQ